MKAINDRHYLSDEGKVFIHKETKDIMGWGICLGDDDSIDNYDEVECPEEYRGNKDFDNMIREYKDLQGCRNDNEGAPLRDSDEW